MAANQTMTLGGDVSWGTLRADNVGATAAGAFVINGNNTITLSGTNDAGAGRLDSILLNSATGPTLTINSNLALAASNTFFTTSRAQVINGNVNLGVSNVNLNPVGTVTETINGIISGAGTLTKSNVVGSTVTLGGANTYSGGTTLNPGILRLANYNSALGTGTLTIAGASTLGTASGTRAIVAPNAINIGSGFAVSVDGGNADLFLTGVIGGAGGVKAASSGSVFLTNAANTYTGGTSMTGTGTLWGTVIGNGSTNAVGSFGTASTITVTTFGSIGYLGAGETTDRTISFSTANGGVVTNNAASSSTSSLTLTSVTAANAAMGLLFNGGSDTVINNGINGNSSTLNFSKQGIGALTINGNISGSASNLRPQGGVLIVNGTSASNETIVSQRTSTAGGVIQFGPSSAIKSTDVGTSNMLGGFATFGGTTWASGSGSQVVSFLGTYSPDIFALSTDTTVTHTDVTTSSSPTAGSKTYSLRFNTPAANIVTLAGVNSITSGGLLVTANVGANASAISGGSLSAPLAVGDIVINNFNTTAGLTVGSVVGGATQAAAFTTGTKVLTGLTSTTGYYVGMSVTGTGIAASSAIASIDSASQVTLNNNTTATSTSNSLSFGNAFGLTVVGPGATVLNGASTYTGTTFVEGGANLTVNANSGGKFYQVAADSTLNLNFNTGGGVYGYGVTVNGAGTSATTGLYLKRGTTYLFQSGLNFAGSPSTVRTYAGTGSTVSLTGFDNNNIHLSSADTASGSVLDSTINLVTGGYGYRISVARGLNTSTGDLIVNGVLSGNAGSNGVIGTTGIIPNFFKEGSGSLLITNTGTSTNNANSTNGFFIRDGSVILSGGTNRLPAASGVILGNGTAGGKLILNGISQTLANIASNGTGTTNAIVGGSATQSTLTITNSTTAVTYAGAIGGIDTNENNIAVAKSGTGTMTLSGVNTYSGATTITAGTLLVTGSIASPLTTVSGTGTLGGTGTAGPVTLTTGGTILGATDGTTGQLSAGALAVGSGSTYKLDVNSTTNTTDVLTVAGNLTLGGSLTVTDLAPGTPTTNLVIATYTGTLTGVFSNLNQGASVDGGLYTIDYGTVTPNAISLVVPEPGTASLVAGAGLLLGLRRRRRTLAMRK